jgi:hypothetical protein
LRIVLSHFTSEEIKRKITNGLPSAIFEKLEQVYTMFSDKIDVSEPSLVGRCLHQVQAKKKTIQREAGLACLECEKKGRLCVVYAGTKEVEVLPGGNKDASTSALEYWLIAE